MEQRKQEEIAQFDNLARKKQKNFAADAEGLEHGIFSSYQFVERWMKTHIKKGEALLDYGCGNGIHSILPAKLGAEVTGIDLSGESLKLAKELAARERVSIKFLQMDCEKLTFPDNSFDYIFDGGTFSSLDLQKAIPELARVLKPSGTLIAIETLGHNPLSNLKRKINKLLGRRTSWAVDHILKIDDLKLMKNHFETIETHYFHLLSLFAFPFLRFAWGRMLLKFLERIDVKLLRLKFLKPFAFKIIVVGKKIG